MAGATARADGLCPALYSTVPQADGEAGAGGNGQSHASGEAAAPPSREEKEEIEADKERQRQSVSRHHNLNLSKADYSAYVASGKVINILMRQEIGTCSVERRSVYGAAIAMPQIARTTGWSRTMTELVVRSYIFLIVNVLVQVTLLYMISMEELVMDKFGGQMYLCDFGAVDTSRCPGAPGCTGPGGTEYTASRLFGWDLWALRTYTRDSLTALFPGREKEIGRLVDPGEYGLESYGCRWLCCFLFMMAVVDDLFSTVDAMYLLWYVPGEAQPWLEYSVPDWADKEYAKSVHGWSELDLVRVKVAGMSRAWKLLSLAFVVLPKFALWLQTAYAGTTFLMETSGIEDLIVNSFALTFILGIDELICGNFTACATRYLLDRLEGYPLYDTSVEENFTDVQHIARVLEEQRYCDWRYHDLKALVPTRLIATVSLTAYFVSAYYYGYCVLHEEDHYWVSDAMYRPKSATLRLISFWFPTRYPEESEDEPYWVMPYGDG